ncbi:MAG TPA: GTPase Era [Desulfomonilaceae bacterium]|nr:GTPase Era [Desulfomonilaceae bacterium]
MKPDSTTNHRSGFVAVAGRPNVGKSTLVNRVLGRELCIVTPKPQTTRHAITAIYTEPDVQMVLRDTPGIHEAQTPLNRALVATAMKTLEEADVILFMVEPSADIHPEDLRIVDVIRASKARSVLAINKIDTVEKPLLLPIMEAYAKIYSFEQTIPISATFGSGVEDLIKALRELLPAGPPLFPEDDISDLPVKFFVEEFIREQITKKTGEEIPYKTVVVVESFIEQADRVLIRADIHAEKAGQKGILIGKGGKMIKQIGMAARKKIEEFLGVKVRLELFVKVTPNWTRDPRQLAEFLDIRSRM